MRCPEFYEKWQRSGNFCEKDPRTAERINAYLDEIQRLNEISTDCSDEEDFVPFGNFEIPEGALRLLISEKDPKIHDEAAKRLVKLAKRKYDKCGKSVVTSPEIQAIITLIKDEIEATKRMQFFIETTKRGEVFAHAKDPYGLQKIAKEPMIPVRYQSDIEEACQFRRSPEYIVKLPHNTGLRMVCAMLLKEFSSKISN